MNDTPPEIEKKIAEMMAARSPADRLRMASSMFETGKKLAIAGILQENPALSEAQIRYKLFQRLYGDYFTPEEMKNIAEKISNMEVL